MKKIFVLIIMTIILVGCTQNNKVESNACGLDSCDDDETVDYSITKNQITLDEILEKIKDEDSFVLYMYFDACPWCKELGPLVSDIIKNDDDLLNMTYALNVRPDGVKENDLRYKNDNGEYNYPEFKELYDYMYSFLDDDKVVYVPTLLFIRNGELVYFHEGTVDSHDAKERKMTDDEKESLERIIRKYYSIYDD